MATSGRTTSDTPGAAAAQPAPGARPQGGHVVAGGAAINRQNPAVTRVDQASQRAAIEWRGFDAGRDHAVVFAQPNPSAVADGASRSASAVSEPKLDLDADPVILSARDSAGPGGPAGESLSGLARAFLSAGARGMPVTHRSVNDQAAAFLVADTLRRVTQGAGGDTAEAPRAARLGSRDDAGRGLPAAVAHPYSRAPFAPVGDGRGRVVATAGL